MTWLKMRDKGGMALRLTNVYQFRFLLQNHRLSQEGQNAGFSVKGLYTVYKLLFERERHHDSRHTYLVKLLPTPL